MFVILCVFAVCSMGMAQERAPYPQLKPGVIYIWQTPDEELIIDGFPPQSDPWAISGINPGYLEPIDGAGPIAMDPSKAKRMNPYHLFIVDGSAGLQASKARVGNAVDKTCPARIDPWRPRTNSSSWGNVQE